MVDYKTFKKEYLNEWVDQSQAARKAAEELAMRDTTSLRDKYKPQNVIMTLNGKQVEFKAENEKNPNDTKYNLFTYYEAKKLFEAPDDQGWRLPTYKELFALCKLSYEFDTANDVGIFDNKLQLPAAGLCDSGLEVYDVGRSGNYWVLTPDDWDVLNLRFTSHGAVIDDNSFRSARFSVRLVRDVK